MTCTFTNTERGTVKVVKKTVPAGGAGFTFTGTAAGTINDGGDITVGNLVAGTYDSTESLKAGWGLESIVCDDGNSSGDKAARKATFVLEPGETVTCTFTNGSANAGLIKTFNGSANFSRTSTRSR